MEFQKEIIKDNKVLKIIGNMDVHNIHKAEKLLMEEFRKKDCKHLIIDLTKVDFVSSAGLRVIVAALKITNELEITLSLSGLNSSVQKVFEIVDMNSMFRIRKTYEDALV
ncbi:anti-sigma factor antagonist [Leptospira sp. GIMC2001]|uniref:anti-sigma factor antagonist n=1 Tax=Leptospira sp. GIMC2001 TaxID=1513297 RepID=UPI002349C815|nr:anti-sigma factor antagonist [Leptospira sp. GIMC2001]WCL47843.1 anti-sigma factor antagonist [Leptospira sp. GIMC2001]